VARRMFFNDSAVTASSVFMRAPHSLSAQFNKPVTTEDVTAVTLPNGSAKERNRHNSKAEDEHR